MDDSPACVKQHTAYNLVQRGLWTAHLEDINESVS